MAPRPNLRETACVSSISNRRSVNLDVAPSEGCKCADQNSEPAARRNSKDRRFKSCSVYDLRGQTGLDSIPEKTQRPTSLYFDEIERADAEIESFNLLKYLKKLKNKLFHKSKFECFCVGFGVAI
ncbi:hypothetical protein WA026_006146 [Henosepilachna vigintioctopunctata]|uniref:Uncharacterized protein n=1 Tax=Henosepilachna vigintioctopunctata TaxID=420089 RepID=A0AAW1TNZ5_9CUCU